MKKIATIQMLRAIAAILVLLAHATVRQAEWHDTDPWIIEIANQAGAMGVWIFFIVSGFIMSYTYYDDFGRPGSSRQFIASRIIRVVPIYWLATAAEVVLRLRHGSGIDPHRLIMSLLFIPVAVEPGPAAAMRPTLGVGWTLNYEMMFYLCFALALVLPRRKGLSILLIAMVAVVFSGAFLQPLTDTRDPTSLATFYTAPIILLFAAGVIIGVLARQAHHAIVVRGSGGLLGAVIALVTANLAVFAWSGGARPVSLEWLIGSWVVCAGCVLLCVLVRTDDSGRLTRVMGHLGDASYSLYLFHFFVIVAVEKLWWLLVGKTGAVGFVIASSIAAMVAALLLYRLVEKPTTNWLNLSARSSIREKQSETASGLQFEPPGTISTRTSHTIAQVRRR